MAPTASPRDRLSGTIELMETIVLALPLYDMLLARQVSQTWRDIIESSAVVQEARTHPRVLVELELPPVCSLSSIKGPVLQASVTLHHDRPITIRRIGSPLDGSPSGLTYKHELGSPAPAPYPAQTLGGCYGRQALRFNQENAHNYITLYPGTAHRLSWDFGLNKHPFMKDDVSVKNLGMNGTRTGKTYVIGVWPNLWLPAYIGTKASLLARVHAEESLADVAFQQTFGYSLPIIRGDDVCFSVVP